MATTSRHGGGGREPYAHTRPARWTPAWVAPLVAGFTTAAAFYTVGPQWWAVGSGLAAGLIVWVVVVIEAAPIVSAPASASQSWDVASMRLQELVQRLGD